MASSSSQQEPQTAPHRGEDAEEAPLLASTVDDEQQTTTPAVTDEEQARAVDDRASHPQPPISAAMFRRVHWASLLTSIVVVGLMITLYTILVASPPGINLPYDLPRYAAGLSIEVLFASIWSTSNLVSLKRTGSPLPLGIAFFIHGLSAAFLFFMAMFISNEHVAWCGRYSEPSCEAWLPAFSAVLIAFLAICWVHCLLHVALFAVCVAGIIKQRSTTSSAPTNLWNWRFPTGEVSFQVSFKVIRQEPADEGRIRL